MSRLFIALASTLAVSLLLPASSAQAPLKLASHSNAPFQEIPYDNSEHHIHLDAGRYDLTTDNQGAIPSEYWIVRNGTVVDHDRFSGWGLTGFTVKTSSDYVFQFNGQGVFSVVYAATMDSNGKNETTVNLTGVQDAGFAIGRSFPHVYVCALSTQALGWHMSSQTFKRLAGQQGGKEINYTYKPDAEYDMLFLHLEVPGDLMFTVTNVPCNFSAENLGSTTAPGTKGAIANGPLAAVIAPLAAMVALAGLVRRRQSA